MSKSVSIDQSHSVIQALANNVDWSVLDGDILQQIIEKPKKSGREFTMFLKNGAKNTTYGISNIINIDRSVPFDPNDPESLFGVDGGRSISAQDRRSIALTKIDLAKVILVSTLEKGEKRIIGEERLKRLKKKADYIRLDAGIFEALWENQTLIPEKWKEKTNGETTEIVFDGTIILDNVGNRHSLSLGWYEVGWGWSLTPLWVNNVYQSANYWSAILPASEISVS